MKENPFEFFGAVVPLCADDDLQVFHLSGEVTLADLMYFRAPFRARKVEAKRETVLPRWKPPTTKRGLCH